MAVEVSKSFSMLPLFPSIIFNVKNYLNHILCVSRNKIHGGGCVWQTRAHASCMLHRDAICWSATISRIRWQFSHGIPVQQVFWVPVSMARFQIFPCRVLAVRVCAKTVTWLWCYEPVTTDHQEHETEHHLREKTGFSIFVATLKFDKVQFTSAERIRLSYEMWRHEKSTENHSNWIWHWLLENSNTKP